MGNLSSPCYDCQFRIPGCHGKCADYKAFLDERKELRDLQQEESIIMAYSKARHRALVQRAAPSQRKWVK